MPHSTLNRSRLNLSIFLIAMSLFCFSISIMRYRLTDTKVFLFLNWNLFLAFIPWLISSVIKVKKINNKISLVLLIFSWLLFFPNSPYILTDLFHLRMQSPAPIWFDLVVILSFAWTGLMFGFISLMDIESILKKYIRPMLVNFISIALLFITAFGIYLGRYLRWNSWDIISNPFGLFNDVVSRFVNPFKYPTTWGMTLFLGILLNMMYFSLKLLKENRSDCRKSRYLGFHD
jgi:uncharacterized membrane protein